MSTAEFRIERNPYGDDVPLFKHSKLAINSGLTVLVGCNGSGKTTLLNILKSKAKERKDAIVIDYNDRAKGGTNRIGELIAYGNIEQAASMTISSEGERIHQSVGILYSRMGSRIRKERPKEAWILMDAVSSGLSIDNIIEIKDFVEFVQKEEKSIDFFFVISTNEYEFTVGADCIDVTTFVHKEFKTYNAYKKFILKTRQTKKRRFKESE